MLALALGTAVTTMFLLPGPLPTSRSTHEPFHIPASDRHEPISVQRTAPTVIRAYVPSTFGRPDSSTSSAIGALKENTSVGLLEASRTTFEDTAWAWDAVYSDLAELALLENGWCGKESFAAQHDSYLLASAVLQFLARSGHSVRVPMVGMDSDGTFVLTWDDGHVVGSMSVYADGEVAYHVESASGTSASNCVRFDDADLNDLLAVITA